MDTSLINLIPNLKEALRSKTLSRSESIDQPPPYTLAPHPSPQRKDNAESFGVPLHIELLGAANIKTNDTGRRAVLWSNDDCIALGPHTTYAEFLGILERKLSDAKVERELGEWKAEIAAEVRGRKFWRFREQVFHVTRDNWEEVLEWLEEGRFRGFRVVCWTGA